VTKKLPTVKTVTNREVVRQLRAVTNSVMLLSDSIRENESKRETVEDGLVDALRKLGMMLPDAFTASETMAVTLATCRRLVAEKEMLLRNQIRLTDRIRQLEVALSTRRLHEDLARDGG